MALRSDYTLKSLLLSLHELASPEIAQHFMDALDLMGAQSPYKGGKRLVELLEFIAREAHQSGDSASEEGAQDAIAYMTGRLLETDLSAKHDLYSSSGQLSDVHSMQTSLSALRAFIGQEIEQLLINDPNATAADIRAYYEREGGRALRFVRARRAGHYGAFRVRSEIAAWLIDVMVDRVEFHIDEGVNPQVDALLAAPGADLLIAAAQLQIRHGQLDELQAAVENPFTKESGFQRLMERASWLFGGEYVGVSSVRRLTPRTEVDLALLRPDGVLHIVELKKANVRSVKLHRGVPITSDDVNRAAAQVANYLRAFDEDRTGILERHGIEARRASGTVVIGHPMYDVDFTEQQVDEVLRSHNADRSRIEIVTYKQLIDRARRALDISPVTKPSEGTGGDDQDR
ncbi:Shedu anti-phage system protein SduA domain-containing protein [Saccharothrix xinjiangensis]|uniref:Shedu anti-phage system protein SduA domain-containing protein n=1 Tax=Saccharothrix xinjiangensis TaxID=204798 RepID=A0ABV9Y8B4_9PSEU